MEFKLKEQVLVKLFAGCLIDPGLRHLLERSSKWKEAKIHPREELITTPFKGKEYIGVYLSNSETTLGKLSLIETEVYRKIAEYCPKYNPKDLKIQIFSQVFV